MFYEPGKTDHGLPHDPFKVLTPSFTRQLLTVQACVIPRPIGWISTVSPHRQGETPIYNLAPFSQFNNLTFDPPYVMFCTPTSLHDLPYNRSDQKCTLSEP
jgi:flavin reductase (DIM6/NTAB) family NADH-FMN oxidoreductase RutF